MANGRIWVRDVRQGKSEGGMGVGGGGGDGGGGSGRARASPYAAGPTIADITSENFLAHGKAVYEMAPPLS